MGKVFDGIDQKLASWLQAQPMFFVATAPLAGDGLVNCSPKALAGTFAVLGERSVAYLDLTGSGVETIAHVRENGRIVLMFCAFNGRPRIVRLHGRGEPVLPDDPRFAGLASHFGRRPGVRSVMLVEVGRISDSCGYGVPLMDFVGDRDVFELWAAKKGENGLIAYRAEKNAVSVDGLPGLPAPDVQR
jgi:predicted pyridoxine 5'-phosphate oxidase superfamily flavin-nucleotide-binding protein